MNNCSTLKCQVRLTAVLICENISIFTAYPKIVANIGREAGHTLERSIVGPKIDPCSTPHFKKPNFLLQHTSVFHA